MTYYRKITIWENRKRVKLLNEFKNLVITYFDNLENLDPFGLKVHENRKAQQARSEINMRLGNTQSIIYSLGDYPRWSLGGQNIDPLADVFNLHHYNNIGEGNIQKMLIDEIERAIGKYESDKNNASLRTVNPLFWIDLILDYIASIVSLPFKTMGFDQEKIKLLKWIIKSIMLLAAILTVLQNIEHIKNFISLIKEYLL